MVMLSTVFLVALVMLVAWGTHPLLVLLFLAPFAFIEGVFLSANILNIPHGGWFSITLAGAWCLGVLGCLCLPQGKQQLGLGELELKC
jgi:K+ transporter